MSIEIFTSSDFKMLTNPGVISLQLLWPGNSPETRLTITRVTVAPGATQPRHSHTNSEQVWIIEQGQAELLFAGERSRIIGAGAIIRTPAGEVHGVRNGGAEPLTYLAITTPPVDFRPAYSPENQL